MLVGSALLMLALPILYGPGFIRALGPMRMVGNRENVPATEGWFARAKRGHANLGENLIPFAALVLVAQAAGVHSAWTRGGAILFLVARLAHIASYIAGAGPARTAAYASGLLGTLIIAGAVMVR